MPSPCGQCESLDTFHQRRCLLTTLEQSSQDGCDGCSLLYNAALTVLTEWHPELISSPSQKDVIEVQWWRTVSREEFEFKIVETGPIGPRAVTSVLQLHTKPHGETKWISIGSAGLVIPDPRSEALLDKIKGWLHACQFSHAKCSRIKSEWSQRVPAPAKRIIDVGNDTTEPRLVEDLVRGYYVALSHCWGASLPLTTTKATLQRRLEAIPMAELPATFQDAIHLVRALKLRYLWIDSLCICQDDLNEWKQEASRMGDIYGGSYLTIAATAAIDSSGGLFTQRTGSLAVPGTDVYVRKKIDHSIFSMPIPSTAQEADAADYIETYPLFQRGWCLQERLLSSRVIHFTINEIVWQCRNCDMCECDGIQLQAKIRSSNALTSRLKYNRVVEGSSGADIWTIWREIVEDYCGTNLSKDGDYLPALSGVAAKFGLNGAGTYIAGLWHKPGALSSGSSPLFLNLLWKSSTATARRPLSKVAPSFSWASRIGPIHYRSELRDGPRQYVAQARDGKKRQVHNCTSVVQVVHVWSSLDRYADAPNATLELHCQLIPCSIKLEDGFSWIHLNKGEFTYLFSADVLGAIDQEANADMSVMPVAAYERHQTSECVFDALVLRKAGDGTYSRVGLVEGLPDTWLIASDHRCILLT